MNREERDAMYMDLRRRREAIEYEIATIEAGMKGMALHSTASGPSPSECKVSSLACSPHEKTVSEPPLEAKRYDELQLELASILTLLHQLHVTRWIVRTFLLRSFHQPHGSHILESIPVIQAFPVPKAHCGHHASSPRLDEYPRARRLSGPETELRMQGGRQQQ